MTLHDTLDQDRRELVELTDDLLGRHCDLDFLRARIDDGTAHTPGLWSRLAETGLVSALVAEEQGGAGLSPAHLSGVLHSLGRHAVPEPYLETAVLAATVLGALPGPVADTWLPRIAAGDAIVVVRLGELTPLVPYAADADLLLDLADDGAVRAFTADELEVTPVAALDPLRPLARVVLAGAGTEVGDDSAVVARTRTLALAGAACLLAGASQRLLDLTVEYVAVREQFGRPVGSFQAVKHKAADLAVMVDMATAAALSAFDAVDEPDGPRRAAAAKAYAGDAAARANVDALQLHGGIGFTWEYHLHIWLKRAMGLAASYGTTTALRRDLARELLARVAGERRG
ncbi:acyl-CoA/acyl-ACP dehydrogenase [Nocardioides carbamazepini]|uniref:acyl-CoA dehydrogenase family protein n=1 Tax=Nocardioides carbamazepini TaxID=2854259 RepID=UPI002149F5EE|nr:acyl-CoA dehydrogenase family protein [Nocardioides carbamazepini]MCR1781351.1 acyl-CoA/acyl-ACP dehydrogenase [Nocardioides carbamazepini]